MTIYTFEVPPRFGTQEAQINAAGIMVEIVKMVPGEKNQYENCLPHHMLYSWIFPRPVMAQVWLGPSGKSRRLYDIGSTSFVPASVPSLSRYQHGNIARRVIVVRYAPSIFDRLEEGEASRYDPMSMVDCDIRDPDIQHGMQRLAKEALAPGFASATMVESIGTGLLVQLARHFRQGKRSATPVRGGLAAWQIRRITERIADETADSIPSLVELATLVGISTSHLRRTFKQSVGCTLSEHIRNVQIERAQAFLSGTEMTIKEIATRLGFSSHYGFAEAFARDTGETPSAFRQRRRACH